MLRSLLRPALLLLTMMTVSLGLLYPLAMTGAAALLFPGAASGSLIVRDGHLLGSNLIGQTFSDPRYFWGRPSATTPQPYNGEASGGSNLGPLNPALLEAVRARAAVLRAADPAQQEPIPVELVTASASGLDPDISPAAAQWQARRVAQARGWPLEKVRAAIAAKIQPAPLGFVGEARVNVLALNLALDDLH